MFEGDLPEDVERVGSTILDVAFRVHSAIGPGALESIYVRCLAAGLANRGLRVEREVWTPITFEGILIEGALRIDMVVDGRVVVEVKAVETVLPVHAAQTVSYLRLGGYPLGYLLNFHVPKMTMGIRRLILS